MNNTVRAIDNRADVIYCPICGRFLFAINAEEVDENQHEGYIFSHDNVPHNIDDMEALEYPIQ